MHSVDETTVEQCIYEPIANALEQQPHFYHIIVKCIRCGRLAELYLNKEYINITNKEK